MRPIPIETKLDSRKVSLGEKLFNEERLSRDNTISCASCHDLTKGGKDSLRGSKSALTSEELRGYELFKNYGCVACRRGVNFGGTSPLPPHISTTDRPERLTRG